MSRHWTDNELIDRMYGIGPAGVHECAQCDARLRAMERIRAEIAGSVEPSSDFLAAQRRAIYSRLGERAGERRPAMIWASASVGALCLALGLIGAGVFASHGSAPAHVPRPESHAVARAESDDAQLFSDVDAMEQASEPRAAAPIHALIEEN